LQKPEEKVNLEEEKIFLYKIGPKTWRMEDFKVHNLFQKCEVCGIYCMYCSVHDLLPTSSFSESLNVCFLNAPRRIVLHQSEEFKGEKLTFNWSVAQGLLNVGEFLSCEPWKQRSLNHSWYSNYSPSTARPNIYSSGKADQLTFSQIGTASDLTVVHVQVVSS